MTTYRTYRNGAGSLTARIRAAVRHFYRTRQTLPASIAVNSGEVSAARGAIGVLGLAVPVEVNGGVLAGEVWLGVQD